MLINHSNPRLFVKPQYLYYMSSMVKTNLSASLDVGWDWDELVSSKPIQAICAGLILALKISLNKGKNVQIKLFKRHLFSISRYLVFLNAADVILMTFCRY